MKISKLFEGQEAPTFIASSTGGEFNLEYLEEKLSYPVRMGVAKEIRGEISGLDSIRLCTAIGLAKYASQKHENLPQNIKNFTEYVSSKIVDIFNNYF